MSQNYALNSQIFFLLVVPYASGVKKAEECVQSAKCLGALSLREY